MAKATVDGGPKRKDDDCDMVTSLQSSELSKNEMCLHEAARKDDVNLIRKIIRRKAANLNCKNNLDRTALHLAAAQGHLDAVDILLNDGKVAPDEPDKYGMTPFLWAAYFGHDKVLPLLVEKGANVGKKNKQGCDILHICGEQNHEQVLLYMFRKHKHIKIDDRDNNGMTPFLLAVSKNSYIAAKTLTEKDCSLTSADRSGRNACHWAAMNGFEDIVDLLIEVEAPEEVFTNKDDKFRTPLIYAAENGHVEVVRLLISKDLDLEDTANDNGMTALHYAAQKNHEEVVKLLVENGARINSRNLQGNTPLHMATFANSPNMVRLLLNLKADMKRLNKREQTPLHCGVEQNKCEATEVLLLAGASLDGIDKTGKTPLLMAARCSYIAMVDMLIKAERFNKKKRRLSRKYKDKEKKNNIDIPTEEDEGSGNEDDKNEIGEMDIGKDEVDGEVVDTISDDDKSDNFQEQSDMRPEDYTKVHVILDEHMRATYLEEGGTYSLKDFNQPYADEFKLYLWKIAFNHLRFGEWKKLAQYWGFKSEQILAIEYQQIENNSYKYHGYRVLCIWFHGIEPDDTPVRGLYEALVSIGRRKLAYKIRCDLDVAGTKGVVNTKCIIS